MPSSFLYHRGPVSPAEIRAHISSLESKIEAEKVGAITASQRDERVAELETQIRHWRATLERETGGA